MTSPLLKEKFNTILDDSLINEIETIGKIASFKKNDIIIDINQPLKHIPLLLSGNIKILREDTEGNDLLIYFLEAGETCTMSLTCCMGTTKSKIRAVAEQDSTLIMIPVQNMQKWFHNNTSWRNFILESYQTRFNEMLEAIDSLAFMKMNQRLHKYLINKKKATRHKNHHRKTPRHCPRFTHLARGHLQAIKTTRKRKQNQAQPKQNRSSLNNLGATQGSGFPLQVLAPPTSGCGLSTSIPSADIRQISVLISNLATFMPRNCLKFVFRIFYNVFFR